jgi:hypothetical protein
MKPLIEILKERATDHYLEKTLYDDQVSVQPTESSVYTTKVKALIKKIQNFTPKSQGKKEAFE